MALPVAQLVKVGFNPRQAALLQRITSATGRATETELIRQGKFTRHQARVLLSGTPSPDGGVTPAVQPAFVRLVREAKFTRHQANAIRA